MGDLQRGASHLVSVAIELAALPAAARARLAQAASDPGQVVGRLADRVAEGLLLATCVRFEIVAVTTTRCGRNGLTALIAEVTGLPIEQVGSLVTRRSGTEVVRHLARVAAGLESPVPGEVEILGQVRRAGDLARGRGVLGAVVGQIVTTALRAGRRARAETGLGGGAVDLAAAAIDRAEATLGSVAGHRAIVAGAGQIGSRVAEALASRGARVTLVNRTESTAAAVANRIGATITGWESLSALLDGADLAVFATSAPEPVVALDRLAEARRRAPLVVIDLGAPRNVAAAPSGAPVVLHDLGQIQAARRRAESGRTEAIERAEAIIEEEVRRFQRWRRRRAVSPVIAALIARGNAIGTAEVARTLALGLGPDPESTLRRLSDRILARVFDLPLRRLATESDGPVLADALARLFALGDPAVTGHPMTAATEMAGQAPRGGDTTAAARVRVEHASAGGAG